MRRLLALIALLTLPTLAAAQTTRPSLPASGDEAADAITDQTRHGEWVDIDLDDGTSLRTWVVYPERSDPAPVVIVIHEIFGMSDWVRSVADSFAEAGYVAIAPDMLSGKGPNGGNTDSFEGDAVRGAVRDLTDEEVVARLNAARTWALEQPSTSESFAAVGFCWGGSTTFMYATQAPGLDAAIVYYGTAPSDVGALRNIEAPVLGLYGGDDARVTSTVDATEQAMAAAQKLYDVEIFDGAGHGFLRQQDGRDGANMQAAEQAWTRTLDFLKAHLDTADAGE